MPSAQPRPRGRRFAVAGLALLALGATSVACRMPREYRVSEVVGTSAGLNNPWEIAFLGDGTMFVTERAGDVSVRLTNGTVRALNQQNRDVVSSGEGGMMGLAIDPGFGTNRRIYTCYLTANDVRVVRWTVDQGLTALGNKQ
ncbi:MAG: PQQ-dependent sugar dehydrogenase, partial [Ilumatobacteraceae bacterium]